VARKYWYCRRSPCGLKRYTEPNARAIALTEGEASNLVHLLGTRLTNWENDRDDREPGREIFGACLGAPPSWGSSVVTIHDDARTWYAEVEIRVRKGRRLGNPGPYDLYGKGYLHHADPDALLAFRRWLTHGVLKHL
jgi:hypothetical protein